MARRSYGSGSVVARANGSEAGFRASVGVGVGGLDLERRWIVWVAGPPGKGENARQAVAFLRRGIRFSHACHLGESGSAGDETLCE